ncbi:uncharacterized protein [Apteryx mantelli]|uniref:Uncharacterized protein n=1 Tax=Apteryx mantelli TaxID=2696672 RepID=A0ABM4FSB8_9AVES
MGNSLGCVKGAKEPAAGKAPLPPKKRVRFKRKRRGKKRTAPEAAPEEEQPSAGREVAEEDEALKLEATPQRQGAAEPAGSLPQGAALAGEAAPGAGPGARHPGRVVQVKERFQGEIQTARLVLEPRAGPAGDSPEEGLTVVARLLENPAERHREKAASRLVELQRTGPGSSRAVLLPVPSGTAAAHGSGSPAAGLCSGASEEPPKTRETWEREESNEKSSSAAWTSSSAVEPGTVSELSTPSPMVEQLESRSLAGLPSSRDRPAAGAGDGTWTRGSTKLPASPSGSSFGTAPCSSGYASDPARRLAAGAGAGGTSAALAGDDRVRPGEAERLARRGRAGTAAGRPLIQVLSGCCSTCRLATV